MADRKGVGTGPGLPALIMDLDGVLYRGNQGISGAGEALGRARDAGLRIVFVTNNSSRTESQVAEKIAAVVGYQADVADIVTSARAAISLVPEGARKCLVVGEDGIREALTDRGIEIVDSGSEVDCVIAGLDRRFDYLRLDSAARAIRAGARFIATNVDPTFPTSDGLMPGAGSIVAAIAVASGQEPLVAGKPERAIQDLIRSRGVGPAWVIGDRLDTDIALAQGNDDWRSVVVLTGVTGDGDDTSAADFEVADVGDAVDLVLRHIHEQ